MTFTLTETSLTKSRCDVSYACTAVTRRDEAQSSVTCDDLAFDSSAGAYTFSATSEDYVNGTFAPGEYEVTITQLAAVRTHDETFIFELLDPCDPPESVTAPQFEDYEYTLGDHGESYGVLYTLPDLPFTIEPSFCPLEISREISLLADGSSAVIPTDDPWNMFKFLYTTEEPLGQTQTITITATSNSLNGGASESISAISEFDLTFRDTCTDPAIVSINSHGREQSNTPENNYTGEPIVFELTEFTSNFARCEFTYACSSVSRQDG